MWPTRVCVPVSAVCPGGVYRGDSLQQYIRSYAFLRDDTQLVVFYDDRTLEDHVDRIRKQQLSGVRIMPLKSLLRKQMQQTLVMDYDRERAESMRAHCFVHLYERKQSVTCTMLTDALLAYALAHM